MKTLVAYTDGGARPNPGDTGYGCHILITDDKVKSKQIKNKYKVTPNGYLEKNLFKKDKDKEVGIDKIIDIYGYNKEDKTNNAAELRSIHTLLSLLLSEVYDNVFIDLDKIVIKIDSTYVLGFLKKIDKGSDEFYDIPNVKLINDIRELYNKVIKKYKNVELVKVSAHIGHIGNEKADLLATMGLYKNKNTNDKEYKSIIIVDGKKYYNLYLEKHPLLDNKLLFKFTNIDYSNRYYLFNYKDEEDIGRRMNDILYSIADIDIKFKELDDISETFNKNTTSILPYIIKLDNVYNKDISGNLSLYGEDYLKVYKDKPYRLTTIDDKILATEIYPPGLSYVAEESFKELSLLLDEYKTNNLLPNYKVLDITDRLYIKNDKGKNILKKEIVNDKHMLVIKKKEVDKSLIANIVIKLGLDIPKRNVLKKLESKNPKVKLIIKDNESYIVYYTLIEVDDNDKTNYVISMNKYANVIYKLTS